MAHSDALRQRSTSVAFGAKPTWIEGESRLIRSKMTHKRHPRLSIAAVRRHGCSLTLRPGAEPIRALAEPFIRAWQFDTTDPRREERLNEWTDRPLRVSRACRVSAIE